MLVGLDRCCLYSMQVIEFDLLALELMIHQRGKRLTVTGAAGYHNGYQITAREMVGRPQVGE
ncbi:Uncharacterised protein [Serratia quinivorans]|uniref:Uncharacterized protein n=1 Tax=Serratia quinivorans TaxID=137545 RepID=A0A380A5X3_9GAMM|nr:Uncharacterised protein [Serratia quinivorans]